MRKLLDVVLDFESYFDQQYSLRNMPMQQYIADDQFEVMGCAVIEGGSPARWLEAEEVGPYLDGLDWDDVNLIGHNLLFDAGVLAYRYGYVPRLHSCTLSYSRAIMGAMLPKCSLEHVALAFGMVKDTQALMNLKGVRLADVDRESEDWARYRTYAISDAVQSRRIYDILLKHMPPGERIIVDILIRMFTQGFLELDPERIEAALIAARGQAAAVLSRAGLTDKSQLRSRDKFAEMLRSLGVNPPTKTSSATGLETYAFAKDDLAFADLLNHPDERVATLVEAKLNASSTINESRAERLKDLAAIDPHRPRLMVPLAYSGAHTHRFSGLDKLNLQNLPRGSELRRAIRAPKGWKLVVRDSSQIEARLTAYIAGQWDLIEQFAAGEDVYASFASEVYRRPVNKKEHPVERFIGKTGVLGLGYGSGAMTFLHMVLSSGTTTIDHEFAAQVVAAYRRRYRQIVNLWYIAGLMLPAMQRGERLKLGPCWTEFWKLRLPSGLHLQYPRVQPVPEDEKRHPDWGSEWQYWKPRYRSYTPIFGAKLVENVIQALARIQITDTMIRMRATNPGWHCALQVHDELVYLAPNDEAETCDLHLSAYMNMQPEWAKDYHTPIPFANEGGIGEVYADCK